MLVGICIILVGLYLLVLGFGAPIEVTSLELGGFKASLKGIGVGAGVAAVGGVVLWLPMRFLKKTASRKDTFLDPNGILRRTSETTTTQLSKLGW